jgi:hypothetical protein
VAQAQAAGVNGFVASWDGANSGPQRFDLLLGVAQARPGFAISPGVDSIEIAQAFGPGVAPLEAQVRAVLQRAANPAFLMSNGRPVVFLYGAFRMQPAVWTTVRQDLAASGLNPFVVGDNSDPAFGFDGLYSYSPNRMSGSTLYGYNQGAMDSARLRALVDPNRRQQLWVATVSPGQDDLLIRPLNATTQSRRGGARYDDTWQDALASSPEWVMVTSWNEWYEDTVIAPSTAYGSRALDQTRHWASTFATSK